MSLTLDARADWDLQHGMASLCHMPAAQDDLVREDWERIKELETELASSASDRVSACVVPLLSCLQSQHDRHPLRTWQMTGINFGIQGCYE